MRCLHYFILSLFALRLLTLPTIVALTVLAALTVLTSPDPLAWPMQNELQHYASNETSTYLKVSWSVSVSVSVSGLSIWEGLLACFTLSQQPYLL